ncbi:MAG: type II toxin-antitoxin system VapC family toxin [Gemmatimonadota bacterium]
MILVDANLLLYAYVRNYPQHARARTWLDQVLNDPRRVGLPWPSLLAFLRISTNPRAFARPASIEEAWRQVREWLESPSCWVPRPTERHAEVIERLLVESQGAGDLVSDAHLAALALEHGLTLCSADKDFSRFEGLSFENPLEN